MRLVEAQFGKGEGFFLACVLFNGKVCIADSGIDRVW